MCENDVIKINKNKVLRKEVIGFFTKCSKCGRTIGGGEEVYYPHVMSENGLVIMRPICIECGEKSAPE